MPTIKTSLNTALSLEVHPSDTSPLGVEAVGEQRRCAVDIDRL